MLKFEIDSLESVDEGMRGLYTQQGDKFVLGVEGLPQVEDTSGLKSALAKQKEALAKYKERIAHYESLELDDLDLETLKLTAKDSANKEILRLVSSGKLEEAKRLLAKRELLEIDDLKAKLTEAQQDVLNTKASFGKMELQSAFDRILVGNDKFLGNKEGQESTRVDFMRIFEDSMIVTPEGIFARDPKSPSEVWVDAKGKVDAKRWMQMQPQARPHYFLGTGGTNFGGLGGRPGGRIDLSKVPTANKLAVARESSSGT